MHSFHSFQQILKSLELMDLCLQGTDYFYRYDQLQLKICITLAYLGWAGVLVVFLIQIRLVGRIGNRKSKQKFHPIDQILFALSILIFIILTGIEKSKCFPFHL